MEVKKGYKQTDVGVIPEDWDVKRLGEIGEAIIGLTYKPTDVHSDGVLVLRSSNVQGGTLWFEDNVFVDMEIPEKLMVISGDILICVRNGSRELIGKSAKIDERAKGMTFGAFMTVFRSPLNNFVSHQFQSAIIKKQINEHLGATINQITNKSLNSFSIPLPPTLAEQEAIAEALSDADALIESLEALLAKKRQVKQGAMSELLSGKRRVAGFEKKKGYKQTEIGVIPEDWSLMSIKNIAKYRRGSFPQPYGLSKWYDDVSGNPFIQVIDVDDNMRLKLETKKRLSKEAEKMSVFAKKDSIIVSLNGSVGRVALTQYDGFIDRTLLLFENFLVPIRKNYFLYALSTVFYEEEKKAPGAILKTITKEHLSNFLIKLPELAEQNAIAEILSDMDEEIRTLEGKLSKARGVKAGMMSALLTGRVRLV